jgi:hypothetical protein
LHQNHLLWITLKVLVSQKVVKFLEIGSLYEVPSVVLPATDGLGYRLVEASQEGRGIDDLYLDTGGFEFFLKRLGDALQGVLASKIGHLPLNKDISPATALVCCMYVKT